MCKTLDALEDEESRARTLVRLRKNDSHLQMLYAQFAIECVRMRHVHIELCQECMDAEAKR